ncbi:hypothetical protein [Wenjunlia vitaminophila]|nr:hypothetical protein [Wenjunlia vitaminophila]
MLGAQVGVGDGVEEIACMAIEWLPRYNPDRAKLPYRAVTSGPP